MDCKQCPMWIGFGGLGHSCLGILTARFWRLLKLGMRACGASLFAELGARSNCPKQKRPAYHGFWCWL
jgi:hypothetical protein